MTKGDKVTTTIKVSALKLMLDGLEDAGLYENDYYALPRVINFWIDKKIQESKLRYCRCIKNYM